MRIDLTVTRRYAPMALLGLTFATPAAAQVEGFKTPSNNIFCILEAPFEAGREGDLRCDIMQMRGRPPPRPRNCPLEWGDAFRSRKTAIPPSGFATAIPSATTN
jgi:hypothetical protein